MDALAALTSFIPEYGQQTVKYYGCYSNKARGQRCKLPNSPVAITPDTPPETEPDDFRRHARRAWARLVRRVYLTDPLTWRKCGGTMRIIALIDNPAVTEKILRHLGLWDPPERPPPSRPSRTLEPGEDSLGWEAGGRLLDGIE